MQFLNFFLEEDKSVKSTQMPLMGFSQDVFIFLGLVLDCERAASSGQMWDILIQLFSLSLHLSVFISMMRSLDQATC